ncbi:hypothetical protein BXU11_07620 [Flavobacterium sp. LM5]|uniref:hypothetical protein n=1 Tax=Flavobacterium sp. LM5 TaxID=1938610 RepID=UPI000991BEED|nr:hypothetical protein [Flavobacterium sp. LM5]OOV29729.1 hypothetical protein BXU11_07620 [Flavobacterium sp. LM5]
MNEQLTQRIQEYLELETNYAIIVNGDYGIGKTHYIKNELFPVIKTLKIPGSKKEETYIPILISLFGVNSIEEIQNQIFIELYPILKNKGVKIFAGLGKSVYKFLSGSDFKELLSDTNTSSSDLIEFNKILLCIDDIDRKSPILDIKEFFGFVNNLVENLNAKILLIANEEELRNEADIENDTYAVLREKVIGVSITFKTNVSIIYDEIIKAKYEKESKNYFDFLTINKGYITTQIEKNKNNLRNLLFFLEHFKIIFLKADVLLKADEKYKDIRDKLTVELLVFTLPIAIEYKLGNLNSSNFSQIENVYNSFSFNLSPFLGDKEDKSNEKDYTDFFKETYFEDEQTKKLFFKSIFNYIIGESSFQIEELVNDINLIYRFEGNNIPERQKILAKLNYWQCIDLSLTDYKTFTKKILEYVDKGEYELEEYPSIFRYATRFNNVINFNLEKLIKRFKKGIIVGKKNYKYNQHLSFRINIRSDDEFYNEIKEIVDHCILINESVKKENQSDELESIFTLFKTDFAQFMEEIQDSSNELYFTPFFSNFDFNKFLSSFKKISNNHVIELAFYIDKRYSHQVYSELNPDKIFLQKLKDFIITEQTKRAVTKFRKIAYNLLENKISSILGNFE